MRYVPHTKEDINEMLNQIGISDIDELFSDIPDSAKLKGDLNLDSGLDEYATLNKMSEISEKNKKYNASFLGAGCYRHYIPTIVKHLAMRSEFYTAYTPYQPEMSQGILQAIFEYQTLICKLTGLAISNASLYDGASGVAEAALMAVDVNKKKKIVCLDTVSPEAKEVLKTYLWARNIELVFAENMDGTADVEAIKTASDGAAAVIAQQPNYFGIIEDMQDISNAAKENGAAFISYVNPISLAVLPAPAEYGADIAVGEGQPLGLPMNFGGPGFGFMACSEKYMRRIPGRVVGQTVDAKGSRAFVLTLQAREQHIRREKAYSNICSNQAHAALCGAIYLSAMGPSGLKNVAYSCVNNAHKLSEILQKNGLKMKYNAPFFFEFVTECNDANEIINKLEAKGILPGLKLTDTEILWCATELTTDKELDLLDEALGVAK